MYVLLSIQTMDIRARLERSLITYNGILGYLLCHTFADKVHALKLGCYKYQKIE